MAVKIRLARLGKKKFPTYRLVVLDQRSKRTGKQLEIVGIYNPLHSPPVLSLKRDRIDYWLKLGAKTSSTVRAFLKRSQKTLRNV